MKALTNFAGSTKNIEDIAQLQTNDTVDSDTESDPSDEFDENDENNFLPDLDSFGGIHAISSNMAPNFEIDKEIKMAKRALRETEYESVTQTLEDDDPDMRTSSSGDVELLQMTQMDLGQARVVPTKGFIKALVVFEGGVTLRDAPSGKGKVAGMLECGDKCLIGSKRVRSVDPHERFITYVQMQSGNWAIEQNSDHLYIRTFEDLEKSAQRQTDGAESAAVQIETDNDTDAGSEEDHWVDSGNHAAEGVTTGD